MSFTRWVWGLVDQAERDVMTLYNSNPWLGHGLGGQSTTAQSTSTSVREAEALARHAQCQQALAAQQAMLQASSTAYQQAAANLFNNPYITVTSTGNQTCQQLYWDGSQYQYAPPPPNPAAVKASTDAIIRSMELLYDWCTPEQRKQLATRQYFDVIGGKTKTRYRIYPPANYNIHQLVKDSEETEVKLCFQPKDSTLPKGDILLCQKLALELDEDNTLAIANKSAAYYG